MMARFFGRSAGREAISEEEVQRIWNGALTLLADIGTEMLDSVARDRLARAGASVAGNRVRFDPDMIRESVALAPKQFPLTGRKPADVVMVGGNDPVASPLYGATHILDEDGTRRRGRLSDLHELHDLTQAFPGLQNAGSNIIEPGDVEPALRHLHTMRSVLTRTDKPIMPVTSSRDGAVSSLGLAALRGRDSLAMAALAFGEDFDQTPRMLAVATCTDALTWSGGALENIELFAAAGQAVMLAPFAVVGQSAPAEPLALLIQITAEILAGAVYAQLIRPGAPVLFGPHFVVLGQNQARVAAGLDVAALIVASGQMARCAGLPFRAAGGLTGAKMVDAQAGAESQLMITSSIDAGAHFLFHATGWLDDGLTTSKAKFGLDAFILEQALQQTPFERSQSEFVAPPWAPGFNYAKQEQATDRLSRLYRPSPAADHRSWDAWHADGARDAGTIAAAEIGRFPLDLVPLPSSRIDALDDFIARRTLEIRRELGC
ncbi:trimethylamine methyltransferase family protein [Mesorhizobium sp.]|uniref:trimethylamine methyltransferase family protein n=1 Tax=Mesorhizobium sp. TaxID=1871066 RepID=UPI000FE53DB2|nr:trimethylamine methyltransferase family protein [Mesorhizobium sp.]RWB66309.1 MAG: hypothetical protein EOQ49_29320 [Mesorhizobium sp.]